MATEADWVNGFFWGCLVTGTLCGIFNGLWHFLRRTR